MPRTSAAERRRWKVEDAATATVNAERMLATIAEQQARLDAMGSILDVIDQRAMAVDGPIEFDDFRREMRQEEMRALYVLATGKPRRECSRLTKKYGAKSKGESR